MNLEVLAVLALEQSHLHWGARLVGAGDSLRRSLGIARQPRYQGIFDDSVGALRDALGDEDFAAAWATGSAMNFEDAVTYALGGC